MIGGLYAKLIGSAVLLAALAGVAFWLHHAGYKSGKAAVQAQWDVVKASQASVAIAASEKARKTETGQATAFAGISSDYLKATSHAYPSIAGTLPGALSVGALRLRNDCPTPPASRGVSAATARSLAADAAATQALADRVQAAIAAVRAGDAADTRERQLDAQVIGLQAILAAERKP